MILRFIDHTGDLGVEIEAATLDELFAGAAVALTEVLADPAGVRPVARHAVRLAAPELDLLLRDWLSDLLFRFETTGFLPTEVRPRVTCDTEWRLEAEVLGEPGAASRLPIRRLVKAVTYHALEVREIESGWSARVIFDI